MTGINRNQSSAKHMLWLVIGKSIRSILMLISITMTARYLGPNNFGLLSFAISMTLLLSVFPGPGLDSVLTKQLLNNSNSQRVQLGSSMAIYLVFSIISFLLLMAISTIVADERSVWLLIAICGISYLPRSSSIFTAFFDSHLAGNYIMYSECIQAFLGLLIRLFLIYIKADIMMFVFAWVGDWTILFLVQILFFNKNFPQYKKWQVSTRVMTKILRQISPLILSGVMILVYQQIDKIMLKIMIDSEAVGLYSLALRLVYAGAIIPVLGVRSLAPKLLKSYKLNNKKQYNIKAQQLYDLTTFMSGGIMVSIIIAAQFIPYICGKSFSPAILIMIIASPLVLATSMGAASGQQMLTENLQYLAPIRNIIGCGLNIILNLVLIPRLAGVGAAIATVTSALTSSFFCMILIPKCRHIFMLQISSILTGFTRIIPYAIKRFK